jgi:membrane protein DedA with SNARE-associated domain
VETSIEQLLAWLSAAPAWLVYLVLGLAAALENIIPPIPADVVVLFGGVVAGQGGASVPLVFLAVWAGNVAGALLVYLLGRRYGAGFFASRWGRLLLNPTQLAQLDGFYRRYGFRVIFVSRFLPMFRAVVPAFAGVSGLGFWRTAAPMAAASGMWYGMIVYLGAAAGRNWREILGTLSDIGGWLWAGAAIVAAGVGWWWWTSRRARSAP